jgi:hypothetical protein
LAKQIFDKKMIKIHNKFRLLKNVPLRKYAFMAKKKSKRETIETAKKIQSALKYNPTVLTKSIDKEQEEILQGNLKEFFDNLEYDDIEKNQFYQYLKNTPKEDINEDSVEDFDNLFTKNDVLGFILALPENLQGQLYQELSPKIKEFFDLVQPQELEYFFDEHDFKTKNSPIDPTLDRNITFADDVSYEKRAVVEFIDKHRFNGFENYLTGLGAPVATRFLEKPDLKKQRVPFRENDDPNTDKDRFSKNLI